jgi:type I restriction enzyme M protein
MATKMCFLVDNKNVFEEKTITFTYIKGMAFSQKQKNVLSFHSSIQEQYPDLKILEISTKSQNKLGVALSAFNLTIDGYPVESVFQSSKVFADGAQFKFLKKYHPKEAKQFTSNLPNKTLRCFIYNDKEFPLEPKSLFHDYIYTKALQQNPNISNNLIAYDIFTDIEFNEKKQINSQARACAIYSYLLRNNSVDYYLSSPDIFKTLYKANETPQQLTLF